MILCKDCKHYDSKKEWCQLLDVPVVDELYCEKAEGVD